MAAASASTAAAGAGTAASDMCDDPAAEIERHAEGEAQEQWVRPVLPWMQSPPWMPQIPPYPMPMPQIPPCPMPIDSSCGNMSSMVSGFIEPTDQQPYQQQRTPKSQGGQQPYQQQRSPKDQGGRFAPKWPKKFEHDWANTGWHQDLLDRRQSSCSEALP